MSFVIDQPSCSCCHRCRLECPVDAIRMKNGKYWIDPCICTSCGHCAENCHNHAISDPENPEPAAKPHEKLYKSCDVLVIGGGGSGLVAAARALDSGKSVILMEKNKETGGSAYFGHMMRVLYSKWHEQAGLADPRDEMFELFKEKTQGRVNNALVWRCLKANAELANWLIDAGELEKGFALGPGRFGGKLDVIDNFDCELNKLRSDPSIGPGASGWFICRLLTEMIEKRRGEILLDTEAYKLLTDGEAVVGALARDPGGEVEVRAKSVIVSAGTYSRNKKIMDKMQPLFYQDEGNVPIHIYACATCTGDGITMCEEIGADIDYENRRACMFGPIHHPYSYGVLAMERNAGNSALLVDKFGAYMDPTDKMAFTEIGMLVDKPGRMAWSIVDQRALDEAVACGREAADADAKMSFAHFERDLNAELRDGSVIKADTLEELAEKTGCDIGNLKKAMNFHNDRILSGDYAAAPVDEGSPMAEMLKNMPKGQPLTQAPYYAIFMGIFQENAIGGMTIDENTAVLRNGKPIPGLYAAGDNTRGIMLPGEIGVAFIEMILSAMTFAMCSGYVAAEEAVKNADKCTK